MRIKIPIIFLVLLFPLVCFAGDLPPFSARVSVSVSGNEDIKGRVESYIGRELRSLGDVLVTDDHPPWILEIVAGETSTTGGYKNGVVLSVVIFRPFDNKTLLSEVNAKSKPLVSTMTSGLCTLVDQWLRVGAPEDLRKICNGIVADFDVKYLQPERDSWQRYNDYLKKHANRRVTSPSKAK